MQCAREWSSCLAACMAPVNCDDTHIIIHGHNGGHIKT